MKRLMIRLADAAVTGTLQLLDALFPDPADDWMKIANATYEPSGQQELLDYHREVSKFVDLAAAKRAPHTEADFDAWLTEYMARGDGRPEVF